MVFSLNGMFTVKKKKIFKLLYIFKLNDFQSEREREHFQWKKGVSSRIKCEKNQQFVRSVLLAKEIVARNIFV